MAQEDAESTEPRTLADFGHVEAAVPVAWQLLYERKLGLAHGPAKGGKTTTTALAVAAVTRGRSWLNHPTVEGDVVICAEELDTWAATIDQTGGDLTRVHVTSWTSLPATVRKVRPVAVIVDTMLTAVPL